MMSQERVQKDSLLFSDLTAGVNRRTAAICFLEVLQLKTWGQLELSQSRPYDEIEISAVSTASVEPMKSKAARKVVAAY